MGSKTVVKTIFVCSLTVLFILGTIFVANKAGWIGEAEREEEQAALYLENGKADIVTTQGHNIALGGNTRAFLQDEFFWDTETVEESHLQEDSLEEMMENYTRVKLSCVSVERDLRIQILNDEGKRIQGENFYITIDTVGAFKDLDRDGVVYVGDLEPGDYAVSISPLEGYLVASAGMNVHVKDALEYRVIQDIALLFETEDESEMVWLVVVIRKVARTFALCNGTLRQQANQ